MVRTIDRNEIQTLARAGKVQIVDVLPDDEYGEAHLPGAINLPLKRLTADTASVLDPATTVVVYCHDGL